MNNYFEPPMNISNRSIDKQFVFLAGTIEQGNSIDWQLQAKDFFLCKGWGVFNPRRKDWNAKLEQKFENPAMFQQVNWELDALEKADFILFNFLPETDSIITMLELGRFSHYNKISVVCPEGYARKANVDIFCNRYNIPLYDSMQIFKSFFDMRSDFKVFR